MKQSMTWNLRGVEKKTRETVKAAARQSGMTMGEWLSVFIQQSITEKQDQDLPLREEKKLKAKSKKMSSSKKNRIDELARQLKEVSSLMSNLSEQNQGQSTNRFERSPRTVTEDAALVTINRRLEESEISALDAVRSATVEAVYARLGNLDEKILSAKADKTSVISKAEEVNYQTINDELKKIVDRLEAGEKPNRETSKLMDEVISHIALNPEQVESKTANSTSMSLEERISHLADQLVAGKR